MSQGTILDVCGVLNYKGRKFVMTADDLIPRLLAKAHCSCYSINPGVTKMYKDLKWVYWWSGMRKDIEKLWRSVRIVNKWSMNIKGMWVRFKECQFLMEMGENIHEFCGLPSQDIREV